MGRSGDGHVRSERFVVVSQILESESLEFLYVVSSEDAERSASASCIRRQPLCTCSTNVWTRLCPQI